MLTIRFTATAAKQFAKIDATWRKRIERKIRQYAKNPSSLANNIKALKGSDLLRLRVGDYRIVFTADGTIMLIVKVGHRGSVYE